MGARPQHSPAYRRFCELLREWRSQAGLTQRGLADRLHKPPSYVHKTEVADRRIDPLELYAWCVACERDPAASFLEAVKEAHARGGGRSAGQSRS